jgi:hypothetical protein
MAEAAGPKQWECPPIPAWDLKLVPELKKAYNDKQLAEAKGFFQKYEKKGYKVIKARCDAHKALPPDAECSKEQMSRKRSLEVQVQEAIEFCNTVKEEFKQYNDKVQHEWQMKQTDQANAQATTALELIQQAVPALKSTVQTIHEIKSGIGPSTMKCSPVKIKDDKINPQDAEVTEDADATKDKQDAEDADTAKDADAAKDKKDAKDGADTAKDDKKDAKDDKKDTEDADTAKDKKDAKDGADTAKDKKDAEDADTAKDKQDAKDADTAVDADVAKDDKKDAEDADTAMDDWKSWDSWQDDWKSWDSWQDDWKSWDSWQGDWKSWDSWQGDWKSWDSWQGDWSDFMQMPPPDAQMPPPPGVIHYIAHLEGECKNLNHERKKLLRTLRRCEEEEFTEDDAKNLLFDLFKQDRQKYHDFKNELKATFGHRRNVAKDKEDAKDADTAKDKKDAEVADAAVDDKKDAEVADAAVDKKDAEVADAAMDKKDAEVADATVDADVAKDDKKDDDKKRKKDDDKNAKPTKKAR